MMLAKSSSISIPYATEISATEIPNFSRNLNTRQAVQPLAPVRELPADGGAMDSRSIHCVRGLLNEAH
jgi:hypothetical protein